MKAFMIFGKIWLGQLLNYIELLYQVPKPLSPEQNKATVDLINSVMSHYANYYTVKALATRHDIDVLSIYTAPWASPFEQSLQWLAGWRPTTMFHLLLSETCPQCESRLMDFITGNRTGELVELTSSQWQGASWLQCEIIKEENAISEEMAEWQMDTAMEFLGQEHDVVLDDKLNKLVEIVKKADDLRFKTLRNTVQLLTPQQVVEFMIAAAELLFGVLEFGMHTEARQY